MSFTIDTIKVLVTSCCNLDCKHCYQYYDKNKFTLKKEQVFEIIDFAVSKSVRVLDFGGGEFFTHHESYEILNYALHNGLEVNVASNGFRLNIDSIKDLGFQDKLTFQFSVDGLEKVHDERRGHGSFNNVIRNAKALYELGYSLTASMALDEKNYTEAIEVMNIPYFERIIFLPVGLVGAAKINSSNEVLKDYEETLCYILKETQCENTTFAEQIFPNNLAIKYDGGVYPSPIASDFDLFCFGNVNNDNLSAIIERYILSDEFKKLSSINKDEISECNSCAVSGSCDRGCRLRALKYFGSLLKPDPFYCKIYNNQFRDIPVGKLFWGDK